MLAGRKTVQIDAVGNDHDLFLRNATGHQPVAHHAGVHHYPVSQPAGCHQRCALRGGAAKAAVPHGGNDCCTADERTDRNGKQIRIEAVAMHHADLVLVEKADEFDPLPHRPHPPEGPHRPLLNRAIQLDLREKLANLAKAPYMHLEGVPVQPSYQVRHLSLASADGEDR